MSEVKDWNMALIWSIDDDGRSDGDDVMDGVDDLEGEAMMVLVDDDV